MVCQQLKSADDDSDKEAIDENIYCQSYSTVLRNKKDCLIMALPMKICNNAGETENDGVVSSESAKFGLYRGECIDESVSHIQIIDILAKRKNRHKIYEFYINLCN